MVAILCCYLSPELEVLQCYIAQKARVVTGVVSRIVLEEMTTNTNFSLLLPEPRLRPPGPPQYDPPLFFRLKSENRECIVHERHSRSNDP